MKRRQRDPDEIQDARRGLLEADDVHQSLETKDLEAWRRAAIENSVPDLDRLWPPGDPTRLPTIEEMRERAEGIRVAHHGVPTAWFPRLRAAERSDLLAGPYLWHELMEGLYGPIEHAVARVRAGDESGGETLVRFLEADVYSHGSGYAKADAIRFLIRAPLTDDVIERLRRVVLDAVDSHDRREFRAYVRLARRVDCDELRQALRERLTSDNPRTVRHARWMLAGLR